MIDKSNKPKVKKPVETQGAMELPGVPNDITDEEAKEADKKAEEVEAPKFKNNGKDIKINLGTRDESKWITVKAGEIVTIPKNIALANGLEEVK